MAARIASPWFILGLWMVAGLLTLMQSLVTAELATRFPKAGGEYQFLKEAYGPFAAFLFGWSFTIFIIACGGGTIAAALGDFAASLFGIDAKWASPAMGCAAIALVIAVNCLGLKTGAVTQNLLTALKALAVLGIAVGAMMVAGQWTPKISQVPVLPPEGQSQDVWHAVAMFFQSLLLAFWPYTGATDPAKLAEETRDVHRSMPKALIATVFILTGVYLFYNYALLCAMSPVDMADKPDVHAQIFHDIKDVPIEKTILLASILICLGSLSSVFLANTRVTFALARDGLIFSFLARMSRHQAPVPSLILCGLVACIFVLNRSFREILTIYFMGSAILFGLSYFSLVVFRLRDRRMGRTFPPDAFRVPAGIFIALVLVLVEAAIAVSLVAADVDTWNSPDASPSYDTLLSLALIAALGVLYFFWPVKAAPNETIHST
ncbi:MAG: APC family permease [Planctomycetes bacterium]|nr:APC family permease [Planctomycetota bacterium]